MLIGKFNHLFAGDKTKLFFFFTSRQAWNSGSTRNAFVLNLTMTIVSV